MHKLNHDSGQGEDGKYHPGRDPRNRIVTCSCGWGYSGTFREVEHRSATHVEIFERNNEQRAWNDPRRATNMPFHTW
jgi:hypothetical protein